MAPEADDVNDGGDFDDEGRKMPEDRYEGEIEFAEKDQPLRDDVRELGALLGEVITELGGHDLFQRVETARIAARARREGEIGGDEQLAAVLRDLSPPDADETVRAFSAYFNLINMAEQVHRIRRRREYQRHGPQPGSLEAVLGNLKSGGVSLAAVRDWLGRMRIEPVFTSHPTEAIRRTLLTKQQRIARALVERIEPECRTPHELRAAMQRIRNEVAITWQTEEHLRVRPTVADEVEHVLFYVTEIMYRILPPFYEALHDALEAVYGPGAGNDLPEKIVRVGSWVGADMDGNPNVGPDTIRATLARQRTLILRRYRDSTRDLVEQLSHSVSRVAVDAAVIERADIYRQMLPAAYDEIPERYRDMPYRVLGWLMHARLASTEIDDDPTGYATPAELLDDLRAIARSLENHHGSHAGLHLVQRFIRRVETFGFHLAALDVRQDADVHRRVATIILGLSDAEFSQRPPAERARILAAVLATPSDPRTAPIAPADLATITDAETRRAIDVMHAIRDGHRRFGPDAFGPFIISMARGLDDVLALLLIARRAGLTAPSGKGADGHVPLDIAPLFETVPDLETAHETLAAMVADPTYRAHLQSRNNEQHVMIGYSDSNKDSGLAASRWALYRAQSELVKTADAAGVQLVIFHGRGGSISRGGGKTREAVLGQPPNTVRGRLRLTEQGEIIHAKYGLRGIATRTLELMTGAVLEFSLHETTAPPPQPDWIDAMAVVADQSRAAYRALVYDDPDLVDYFYHATPIDAIQRMLIGSRPASRRFGAGIRDLRAIPWVFAWTQSRHILTGWYGVGVGLRHAVDRFGLDRLQTMAREWPFFATVLADVEMVMAKADMPIAARYADLAGAAGQRLFPRILDAFRQTERLVCDVRGIGNLLDREPVLHRNIRLRNPYVDPMSLLQVDLLRRWRAKNRDDAELERALFTTIKGIARGLQNTG